MRIYSAIRLVGTREPMGGGQRSGIMDPWNRVRPHDTSGASAVLEAFLGGRSLPAAALAVSVLASVATAVGVVSFVGHYYAYGFHLDWALAGIPLSAAIVSLIVVPLLYDLRVTSVFQYLRMRFDNKVGITACVVYFILSQSVGAVGIFSSAIAVSTSLDQMAVQRFMAARTLSDAKRIALAGPLLVLFFFFLGEGTAMAIMYWFRDCDPLMRGAIRSYDEIVPHYMMKRLVDVPMLRGLFLAGLVGASTSTISSIVNSHAAIFYIDIVSPYTKMSDKTAVNVMRLLGM
ncbi:hypothetical protein HPB50_014567 [Hyalomma asiaticum]|uniref:Uncharacterized protein n=1 Tax=Hyalomma asiaticum TaxID=266040 RepID=A0ACB7RPH0_HYAAI|nr:hypothetical protein HPB50_014567 [Hyalomma asiaticum]